jgi:hypothetical protein
MFLVHRAGRDTAGITWCVDAPLIAEDKCDRTFQHHHARVEVMRVSLTVGIRVYSALADFVALAPQVGFEFGSIHLKPLSGSGTAKPLKLGVGDAP